MQITIISNSQLLYIITNNNNDDDEDETNCHKNNKGNKNYPNVAHILHNCYALKSRNFNIHFNLHLVETVARF